MFSMSCAPCKYLATGAVCATSLSWHIICHSLTQPFTARCRDICLVSMCLSHLETLWPTKQCPSSEGFTAKSYSLLICRVRLFDSMCWRRGCCGTPVFFPWYLAMLMAAPSATPNFWSCSVLSSDKASAVT